MRLLVKRVFTLAILLISLKGYSQQLIQATIKLNSNPDEVEVWLKPNFSNTTQYLAQIGIPIAWPVAAPAVQPASINVTLASTFVTNFGNNYTPFTINPLAHNSSNTVNYFNIVLIRSGGGASNPQIWNAGQEFHLLTVKFPTGTPNAKVKVGDFQDGGSDGQGYFYSADGNANYYMSTNSKNNFYASGQSTVNGDASEGYVETNSVIPVACAVPSISINNITNVSADVNWPVISGALGYEYAITTTSTPPSSGTSTTSTTFNTTGLTASTQYYVHVRTNCGGGNFSNWSTINFATSAVACIAPATPTVNPVGITTADFSWNAVSGATGYEYFLSTSSTTPGSAPGTGATTTGTTYNATGLTGGTQYYIFVRTNCGNGNFSPWVSATFTTQPPLCTPTSTPIIGGVTSTTAGINWSSVSGSSGYEYEISTSSGIPVGSGTTISAISFTATALIPGTTYYVFVRNNCGGGLYSNWTSASFNTPCPTPASITIPANTITSSSATISWNSTGATSYQYDISTSSVPTSATPSTGGTTTIGTTFNATGLASGTTYYVYIRSICGTGNFSQWENASFTTICPVPNAALVDNIKPTSASISWTGPADAEYEYLISTSSSYPNTAPGTGITTIFTSLAPGNLIQGTQYYFYLRVKCNPGIYSNWIVTPFKTPYPPCNPPASLSVKTNESTATLEWPNVPGASNYEYFISESTTIPATGNNTTSLSQLITGLNPSTKYYVYVRTSCGNGRYSDWTTSTFNTPCFKPTPFIVNNISNAGTAVLGWQGVKNAKYYEYAITRYSASPMGSVNRIIDTIINASGLEPGVKYFLHVRTHCDFTIVSDWNVLEFFTSGIAVFSTSVAGVFNIRVYQNENSNNELILYNSTGQRIKKIRLISNTATINMNQYSSGIYYLKWNFGKEAAKIITHIK